MIKKNLIGFLYLTGFLFFGFQLIAAEYIWREAEDSAEYYPIAVKSDLLASDYIYIGVLGNASSTGSAPSDGHMVWTFTTTQTGTFYVWCRVKAPWSGGDSYWVKMDSGNFTKWEGFVQSPGYWEWRRVNVNYSLTNTGTHTLTMAYSANLTSLDKILITNDSGYTPSGLGTTAPKQSGSNSYRTSSVVDVHKNLKVVGKQLQNQNGQPVQLRGLVTHGVQWYPAVTNLTIPNLAQNYKIDMIRIAMYVEDYKNGDFWGGYLARPAEIKAKTKELIDDGISAGIYVIISWHIHNNPLNFTSQASSFFQEMSQTYGGYPNVMYEICNEPEFTGWEQVKSYANTIIPVIRNNDPDSNQNIIIVGTPNWCQDLLSAANSPLTGYNNILYSFHFYAASHEGLRPDAQIAINMGLPVIVTEWGTTDYTGGWGSEANTSKAQEWVTWMNSNGLSWTNWSLGNKNENSCFFKPTTALGGPWTSNDLTTSGNFIVQKLAEAKVTSPPQVTPTPNATPTPTATATRTATVTRTATSNATPAPTPTPTPAPAPSGSFCSPATIISVPFTFDGQGEHCWETTTLGNGYINSWNLSILEINGVNYSNRWFYCPNIPPVNNKYVIRFYANATWGHFEIRP